MTEQGPRCANLAQQNEVETLQSTSPWTADFVYFLQACLFVRQEQFVENLQVLFGRSFVSVFARMLSQDCKTVEKILDIEILLANEDAASNLRLLVRKLLDPLGKYGGLACLLCTLRLTNCFVAWTTKSSVVIIRHVFETVRAPFVPVYRFALNCLLSFERQHSDDKDELDASVLTVIRNMANRDENEWTRLLSGLDGNVLKEVCTASPNYCNELIPLTRTM